MNKRALVFLIMVTLVFSISSVCAQEQGRRKMKKIDAETFVNNLTQELNLTAEQQNSVRDIVAKYRPEIMSIRQEFKGKKDDASRAEMRAKIKEVRLRERKEIASILTDEQKQKFQADKKQREGATEE